ncbi:hypothetical protein Tco_1536079, partial [Tanacetum coccineum]
VLGNTRKDIGFSIDVLEHMQKNYNVTRQIYDMVNEKWKTVRPKVAQFNVTRREVSGVVDGDYTEKELLEYQVEDRVPFTLLHVWAELKDCSKWKEVKLLDFEAKRQEKNK